MLFWILSPILTILTLVSIAYPLFRKSDPVDSTELYGASVYRDQLKEIDREVERGQIAADEADLARTEIARRLLALSQSEVDRPGTSAPSRFTIITAICTMVLLPFLVGISYLALGSPGRTDMPLQARMSADPATQSIEELVARAESRVQSKPDVVRGWKVLAPVYMRLGRASDAANAFRQVLRLSPENSPDRPQFNAALGEALTAVAGGIVTVEAKQYFENAAKGDPNQVNPQYFLAIAYGQEGDYARAIAAWQELLTASPENAPWLATAKRELQRMHGLAGTVVKDDPEKPKLGGPTSEQVASAAGMSQQDRTAMIEGMVENLAEKLAEDPSRLDGWLRLIRSYAVLGRTDEAQVALNTALAQFADDSQAGVKLSQLASSVNLKVKSP